MISEKMTELGKNRSVIREIFEYSKKRAAEIGAENVFDFSLGNPNVPAPEEVHQVFKELLDTRDDVYLFGYTSAQGDLEVRKAIADDLNRRFQTNFRPDNFYMTCGAAASLRITLEAMTVPGDEYIIFTPYFRKIRFSWRRQGDILFRLPPTARLSRLILTGWKRRSMNIQKESL